MFEYLKKEEYRQELERILPKHLYAELNADIERSIKGQKSRQVFEFPITLFKKWEKNNVKRGGKTFSVNEIKFNLHKFTFPDPTNPDRMLEPWDRYREFYLRATTEKQRMEVLCMEFYIWVKTFYEATGDYVWKLAPKYITVDHLRTRMGGIADASLRIHMKLMMQLGGQVQQPQQPGNGAQPAADVGHDTKKDKDVPVAAAFPVPVAIPVAVA